MASYSNNELILGSDVDQAKNLRIKSNVDGTFTIERENGTDLITISSGNVVTGGVSATLAGNGPAFRAYPSAATSVTSGFVKVTFGNASGTFDTTNSKFQPTVAGYYQINGRVGFTSAAYAVVCAIYKNGANYSAGQSVVNDSSMMSDVIYMDGVNDKLELYAYSATTQNSRTEAFITYFSGFLARAA